MNAAVLLEPRTPLRLMDLPIPKPVGRQVLVKVSACGVCRTDLHIVDGELTRPKLPLVCGHQIVGTIAGKGNRARRFRIGTRVGVPWLASACGDCSYCKRGDENLCDRPQFTGYTVDGGFAEYAVADERYCLALPDRFGDAEAAPLLCAGLIGYRALSMVRDARLLGLYGFGAAAHLITQVAVHRGVTVYAFTKEDDEKGRSFARSLGACWAGSSNDDPPHALDAAIIFAPAGELVPVALKAIVPGGAVVCAGIHMSDIPSFPYALLWGERSIRSVANLTRRDGREFMRLVREIPLTVAMTRYPLSEVNKALDDLRAGKVKGSAVVTVG